MANRQERLRAILDKKLAEQQPQTQTLPNLGATEALISGRESGFKNLAEDLTADKTALDRLNPIKRDVSRLLNVVGGTAQALEAGIANPLLELQKGGSAIDALKASGKGLSSKRLGEIGDVIRTTGFGGKFNKAIASTAGFIATVGLTNLATKGKLAEGANKVQGALKKSIKRQAVKNIRKRKQFFIQKADDFIQGIDDAFTSMRQEFDDVYKKIGDNAIDSDSRAIAQSVVDRLPEEVLNNVKKNVKITGKEIKSNINTVKTIKTELGRKVPQKVWSGLEEATETQAKMMSDYFDLNKVIANNAGQERGRLLQLNAKFKSLHDANRGIKPLLKKGSGVTKTNIRNIHKEASQGDLREMERFSRRFFNQGTEILTDIDKFNRQQKFIKGLQTAGVTLGKVTVGGALVNQFIRKPLIESVGGGSTTVKP